MPFIALCLWGMFFVLSIFGYGNLLLRLLHIKEFPGLSGIVGVSFLITLGGILNLVGWVHPPMLVGLVVLGVLLLAALTRPSWNISQFVTTKYRSLFRGRAVIKFQVMLLCGLFAIPILGSIRGHAFNTEAGDDPIAYFAFPIKMLQLGSLGPDPFSERRLQATVGGGYFLQTFMLVLGDVRSIPFTDVAIGYLLLGGVIIDLARRRRLSILQTVLTFWLLFWLQFGRLNATMMILPAALFASLFLLESEPLLKKGTEWKQALLLALIISSICTLKSTYMPTAVMSCCLYYLALVIRKGSRYVLPGVGCVALCGLFLFPWLLDMKRKEGTYLFPLLGRGYDISSYNNSLVPAGSMLRLVHSYFFWEEIVFFGLPLIFGVVAVWVAARKNAEREQVSLTSMLLASALGVVALNIAVGGESLGRYSQPFLVPMLIAFTIAIMSWWNRPEFRRKWLYVTAAATGLYIFSFGVLFATNGAFGAFFRDVYDPSGQILPLNIDAIAAQARTVQAVVPAGKAIFARVRFSYPFDFRRNPVFIGDIPGMSSLPPGMPLGAGPMPLRQYFLDQKIRYIFFDYQDQPEAPPGNISLSRALDKSPSRHHWTYVQGRVTLDVESNLLELGKNYRKIYDDGNIFVIDLSCLQKSRQICPAP
jgi:hypothetical protein